jgi:uncharacterized protein (DUF1330 family)
VPDPEAYKPYQTANATAFGKFGGRFLVRGGRREVTEGRTRSRVVIEFRATTQRSPVIVRRNTERQRRCGRAKASSI